MIILARESRGMNQYTLAEKIGMTPTNLSKVERGDYNADNKHIEKIAAATNYPVSFFYQTGTLMPENLTYRKRDKLPAKVLTPIHAQANVIRQHVQLLTRTLKINPPELPFWEATDEQTPADIADKLRQKWDVKPGMIDNMVKLVEKQGILTVGFSFGTYRVDSKTIWTENGFPVICLNSLQPGDRQRFSLAFELGQIVMHRTGTMSPEIDLPHEANLFAASFLMPQKDISLDFADGVTVPILAELKRKWKVSMISLLYRADDLQLVNYNQKRWILQQFNAMRIRRREPVELDVRWEEPRLMKQYIAHFKTRNKFNTAQLAEALCLHVQEFIELYS